MANLRFVSIKAVDSVTIRAKFTNTLNPLLNTGNVTVVSNVPGVPDAQVRSVRVRNDFFEIETLPMTPYAAYIVTFQSTDQVTFSSLNGQDILFEDGITNAPIILGPELPANEIRDVLINYQKDSVYSLLTGSIARDIINSQSDLMSRALHDIGQAKNDNYLSRVIVDETKERGKGPYDRLQEEGAYEVIRVGLKETGATASGNISFTSFPSSPITLQGVTISSEELVAGTGAGTFNGLTLTVNRTPVTKLNSVTINYAAGGSDTYAIDQFGYQIKEPRYDQEFASTLITLEDNQVKLSAEAVRDGFVSPVAGDTVVVNYDFKDLGRIVDEETVSVSQVLDATREVTPPISNQFSLARAPVVNANNQIPSSGAISFLDPQSNPPFSATHPAFAREIPFRFERLPSNTGEYSVDYATGTVYVYGAEENDGSGNYPPVATYKYRNTFASRLDYTYDPTTYELVASPLRDLRRQEAAISFDFEPTLVPGTDFEPQVHAEVLDERIENRLLSTNSLRVLNAPVTAAFRVFNETSGEIYSITRFNDNTVFFNSRVPPRIFDADREATSFKRINNELLIIDGEFTNVGGIRVLRFLLSNNRISDASEDALGSSFNSSVTFSRSDIFGTELYFDGQVITLAQNTDRLEVGQFQIDYENGILYVGVANNQAADVGTINYNTMVVAPANSHVISVNEIYHSISNLQGVAKRISLASFAEGEIVPQTVDRTDERFTNNDPTLSYTVNNGTIIVTDDIKNVRNVYDAEDLTTNVAPTNFADDATFAANVITLSADGIAKQELLTVSAGPIVTVPFISSGAEIVGVTSVIRVNDGVELYDAGGSFSGYDISLSGVGSPSTGDVVLVKYSVGLNGSATPIVDYNRGDYFVDYTYLADEILVSYEHGDNVLDFRNSISLDEGDTYYVTYRVGALRDALLKNFGSLVDIPVINSFDTTFPRENYRDALTGALQSFTKGPTIPAMKTLVSSITHIDPDIAEAVFNVWSLGIGYLFPNAIMDTGDIQLMKGKFGSGALVSQPDQTISFPLSSNFRVEEGTVEFWAIPEWDGIDNDATLTFSSLTKDGALIPAESIFIGASSFNPTFDENNEFTLNRMDEPSPIGLPSKVYTHVGLFIYYDTDVKKWKVLARDSLATSNKYTGTITSSGEVYNVGVIETLGEINDVLRSDLSSIYFEFNLDGYDVLFPDGYVPGTETPGTPIFGPSRFVSLNGMCFNGIDENIHCGNAGPLQIGKTGTEPVTWQCWAKSSASVFQGILGKRPNLGLRDGIHFALTATGAVELRIAQSTLTDKQVTTTTTGFNDGEWHHFAFTFDGVNAAGMIIYVDGSPVATSTDSDDVINNYNVDSDFTIGSGRYTDEYFDGCIDDVAIYDKALSAAEITTIYNGGNPPNLEVTGPVSNMVGYWLLGDNFVAPDIIPNEVRPDARPWPTLRDFSTSGFDGTATGDSTPPAGLSDNVPGDPIDTSIEFNAGPNSINMGDVTNFEHTDAFSVVGWVRQKAAAQYSIIHKDPLGFTHGWAVHLNGAQQVNFRFIDNLSNQIDRRSSTGAGTVWRHFVATYDGSGLNTGINLYHNGSIDNGILGASDVMAGSIQNSEDLEIGAAHQGGTTLSGFVAHIAIYDKELTASEASTIYNGGTQPDLTVTGPTGNLVGYWKLGDDIGGGDMQNMDVSNISEDTPDDGYALGGAIDGYTDGYAIPGDGYVPGFSFDGICFMADQLHYFVDWGKEVNRNRFSIFKDGRGYLNLHVYDKNGTRHPVTTDISDWMAGLPHHIAASWRMNTSNRMDELHLFVDGQEVHNIMRFGGRPKATTSDRFRTVKPEIVVGTLAKNVRNGNDLITTQGSAIVESATLNFDTEGIVIGDTIRIIEDGFTTYTILNVSGRFLTLDSVMPTTLADAGFSVNEFSTVVETQIDLFTGIVVSIIDGVTGDETEIAGIDAVLPAYSISKNLFNQNVLTLLGSANAGDQIAIRTLGLNHRRFRDRQFVWGDTTSILKTQLPPPLSLDEASIIKVLMPLTPIGLSNAALAGSEFVATSLQTYATTNETEGRTLTVRATGSNVTFSPAVEVTINGTTESGATSEVVSFTSATTQTTTEKWKTISGVDVVATPIDDTRDSTAIEIKEAFAITESEGNATFPVIRYSYQLQSGSTLEGTGNHIVTDNSGFFAESFEGQALVVTSPAPVAGTYTITSKIDNNNVTVSPTPPAPFTGGVYTVYQTSIGRSGFQNGFFTFETAGFIGTPFALTEGPYDFDYSAYLEVPIDPVSEITVYVGSDFNGNNQAHAIIDELRTLTRMLGDVRVGETIADNEKSITTDFTAFNPFEPDSEALMLLHFESIPFINDADLWISSDRAFIQSDSSLNNSFEKSLVLLNRNLVMDNQSTLTRDQGSIEFWVSPRYDTFNDPNVRFYFDASAAVIEELETINRGSVTLSGSVDRIISVRLQTDLDNSGREYFAGGSISSDGRTAFLGKPLPQQNTPVKVAYVPSGLSGDRISVFKDQAGFVNFNVRASGIDYEVRQPIFWARDTWHRVMATYKVNSPDNQDEIRLFVDGEERGTVLFGSGILFGQGIVFGQGFAGEDNSVLTSDINFNDPINQLFLGSDFEGANFAQARFDNIRLSNLARIPLVVGGQARDINYSANISTVLPVVEDLFTTKLLDFNKLVFKAEDMAILRDEAFGLFNFDITVIDSFDIVLSSAKIQQVLESLIFALKPATSKVNIDYVQ
jgi:hypothetical protein